MLRDGELNGTLVRNPLPLAFSYLYAPRGPFGAFSAASLRDLSARAREHADKKTLFLRIEPFEGENPALLAVLKGAGFSRVPSVQPRATRVLDLAPTEEELLKGMEHDTRYAIRVAGKRGVQVKATSAAEDLRAFEAFWELFRATNERHGLKAFARAYYEGVAKLANAKIFLASREGVSIASAIILFYKGTATYLYAASRPAFGKFNAPSLVLWEAIRAAKRAECDVFDFWGISNENKRWAGVTAFKKSFGGREVSYVGTWDLPFKSLPYRAYMALRKILR